MPHVYKCTGFYYKKRSNPFLIFIRPSLLAFGFSIFAGMKENFLAPRRLGAALLLWLLPVAGLYAQGKFFTRLSDKTITADEELQVEFVLQNPQERVSDFRPPIFKGFQVVSGPSQMSNTQIIHGQKSSEIAYIYVLRPRKKGTLTIGSATAKIGRVSVQTRPVSVVVTGGKPPATTQLEGSPPYVLTREAIPPKAYTGQQISLDLKLYDRDEVNVQSYNLLRASQFPGFYAEPLRSYRKGAQEVEVNGTPYTLFTLNRTALFPQRAGTYTIEPVVVRLTVLDAGRQQNFFFRPRGRNIDISSDSLQLEVLPLPQPMPPDFCGGTGYYEMQSTLDKTQLDQKGIAYLLIKITGNGDPKRLNFQLPPLSDSLETYEPEIIEDRSYENAGQLWHTKTWRYAIRIKYPGIYQLAPTASYFDTDSLRYMRLQPAPIRFMAKPGKWSKEDQNREDETAEAQKVLPPLRKVKKLYDSSGGWWVEKLWFRLLLLLPFLLLAGSFLYDYLKGEGPSEAELARQKALAFAERQIQLSRQLLQEGKARPANEALYKALQAWLHRRLGIPAAQLSSQHLAKALSDKMPETGISALVQLFRELEEAIFAGQSDAVRAEVLYEQAKEFIAQSTAHKPPPASRE